MVVIKKDIERERNRVIEKGGSCATKEEKAGRKEFMCISLLRC
jgi:hypothetical protein